ncbi:N-acetylmuramoyl-L-alanine amidase [Candidatus Chloroploca asiatica]|uniref:N-acetylmuramoyl-L-alanine amidase n=1 Tax=Candidatus Chloroploca asiatica TaxID=1506545 RepID=UPI000BE9FB34|nr:N-acetylmuramoyl-L-alanine amidase [Candidatus Chloroploca asiatica]
MLRSVRLLPLVLLSIVLLAACTPVYALAPTPTAVVPDPSPVARAAPILAAPTPPQAVRSFDPAPTSAVVPSPVSPTADAADEQAPTEEAAEVPAPEDAPGATGVPTPTPRDPATPPRVGLQVGHLRSNELPDELARLRTSTGARWGRITEAELNLEIVNRITPLLEAEGVVVDIIPATVPPGYDADAFLAIHADGSTSGGPRGWKLATPWRASEASKALMAAVGSAYGPGTGMPEDVGGVTFNMKGYYAFSWRRYTHAITSTTPAIIVEMGFMTNAADREILFGQPDRIANAIATGILDYLKARDPNDGAALLPPDYPVMRALADGTIIRAIPQDNGRILARVGPEARIVPFDLQDGWYQVFTRVGDQRIVGWVREDQVAPTNEQSVFPTPTNP